MEIEVHEDAGDAAVRHADWDDLACGAGRPFASPHWLLAWWRHLAPRGSILRILEARAGDETVGVLPLHAMRRGGMWHYATLGTPGMALRGTGVVRDGSPDAARALAGALAGLRPAPASVHLGQVDHGDPLAAALAGAPGWSARRIAETPAPVLDLHPDGYEAWLAGKSGNFRQDIRRKHRRLERDGARMVHVGDAGALADVLASFDRMHEARWGARSPLVGAAARALMREVIAALAARGRVSAECAVHDDEVVAVQFFMHAGRTTLFWNGAWDERWAPASPGVLTVVEGIATAHRRGMAVIDLGDGEQPYKSRLAGRASPVSDVLAHPRNARGAAARAMRAARALARRLRSPGDGGEGHGPAPGSAILRRAMGSPPDIGRRIGRVASRVPHAARRRAGRAAELWRVGSATTRPLAFAVREWRSGGDGDVSLYRLKGSGDSVLVRHGTPDTWSLEEVFSHDDYAPPPAAAARIAACPADWPIVDAGAYIGLASLRLGRAFPGRPLVSYEPDPANAALARANAALNPLGVPWEVREAAVGVADGSARFLAGMGMGSRVARDGDAAEGVTVRVEDLLARTAHAALVKLDVEGAEWGLLADPRMARLTGGALVLEWHLRGPDDEASVARSAMRGLLASAGMEVIADRYQDGEDVGVMWALPRGPAAG